MTEGLQFSTTLYIADSLAGLKFSAFFQKPDSMGFIGFGVFCFISCNPNIHLSQK